MKLKIVSVISFFALTVSVFFPFANSVQAIDCNSAWKGSDADHAQYYCQGACAYYDAKYQEGWDQSCEILAQIEGALAKCPVCSMSFDSTNDDDYGYSSTTDDDDYGYSSTTDDDDYGYSSTTDDNNDDPFDGCFIDAVSPK